MGEAAAVTVALTAERRRQEQALLLRRAGFRVVMFPLLSTEAASDAALRATTEALANDPPDYLVANTGYGMRTWFACATNWGLMGALSASLATRTKIVARGAKALGELRKAGLDALYKAPNEVFAEVVEWLLAQGVAGKTVAVQLHGEVPAEQLARLEQAGAHVACLAVYTTAAAPRGQSAAPALAQALADGSVDAVTFTAAPQVRALFGGTEPGPLLQAFNSQGVVAACIGPVCADTARTFGIESPLVAPHPRLGSLVSALARYFATKGLADRPLKQLR